MNEDSLREIESRLGIALPKCYRALHQDHANRLQQLKWDDDAINPLYLTADHVISPNLEERQPEMGAACAFPNWWESFFMIGTNGGGDYYCLRLDNAEGVWLIGSDCEETPTQVAGTLLEHVEATIANHESEKAWKAKLALQRAPFQQEIDAHLAAIKREGGSSRAAEWMTIDAIYPMFEWLNELEQKISPRKLRLYGIALCQLIPGVQDDADAMEGIALAKAMTFGIATQSQISNMRSHLRNKIETLMASYQSHEPQTFQRLIWRTKAVHALFQGDHDYLTNAPIYPNDPDLARVYSDAGHAIAGYPYGVDQAADMLREVLGNPFHPTPFPPRWRTPEVVTLAQSILQEEHYDELPKLVAALSKAGCDDARILAHCQRPHNHFRGCWVVDMILEKE